MASPDEDEQVLTPPKLLGYRLTIHIAGLNHVSMFILDAENRAELIPEFVKVGDVTFERYLGETDDDYTEVRYDLVVRRDLERIFEQPKTPATSPTPASLPGSDVDRVVAPEPPTRET